MNWNLIFKLSLFGLFMAFATVYFIPSNIEPFCWLAIFIVCAYLMADALSSRYFLHGLAVGIVNSVWITTAHILLFDTYIHRHPQEAAMMAKMPDSLSPKLTILVTGLFIGAISGLILALFAIVASKIVRKQVA